MHLGNKIRNNGKRILVWIIIFALGIFVGNNISSAKSKSEMVISEESPSQNVSTENEDQYPYLNLPVEYFSKTDVQWGSLIDGERDDTKITSYDEAIIKNLAVYQSYPTQNIKIESYSNEITPLKLLSASETQAQIANMEMGNYQAEESFKKFGVLTSHYLPEKYILSLDKFDVDGDGQDESIVSYSQTFAAGIGAPMTDIIKGNNVIFTLGETGSTVNSIIQSETNNGFYAEWGAVGEFKGRCCEEGVMRTRFVYKDGKFMPLYEQEVRYLKIGKEYFNQ